jgi:hypothetical protein
MSILFCALNASPYGEGWRVVDAVVGVLVGMRLSGGCWQVCVQSRVVGRARRVSKVVCLR